MDKTVYIYTKNGSNRSMVCNTLNQAMRLAVYHHENRIAVPDRIINNGRAYSFMEILKYCKENKFIK